MREMPELNADVGETRLLELPGEMLRRIFKDVTVPTDPGQAEVVEYPTPGDKAEYVAQPVKVRRRAEQQTAWSESFTQPLERDMSWNGKMLDYLREEDDIELSTNRRVFSVATRVQLPLLPLPSTEMRRLTGPPAKNP